MRCVHQCLLVTLLWIATDRTASAQNTNREVNRSISVNAGTAETKTVAQAAAADPGIRTPKEQSMELGAFSISLAVKDLATSRQFYEKLGFKVFMGDPSQNWLIMKNGDHVIGLFQGMFDKNILTFNPGWNSNAQKLGTFTDVRELQRRLKSQGVQLKSEADENTKGPASFIVVDPDGNPIFVDQHV